jgi:DNA-binding LytR/AlgR family response regulator
MPTALIAEDEPLLAAHLKAELASAWPALHIVAEASDGPQALRDALALRPNVCFLDIRMPGASGLDVAQALTEDWPEAAPFPLLVFVTAYDQYALQAFEAQAVDYLLKPLQRERLQACVQRLRRTLEARSPDDTGLQGAIEQLRGLLAPDPRQRMAPLDVLQVGVGERILMVPVDEVLYFEAADKYLRVVTAGHDHLVRLSLRELLPQLDPQRFWQVHRGTVVQLRAVHSALRDEAGRVWLMLHQRPERLAVSRLHAPRFKAL